MALLGLELKLFNTISQATLKYLNYSLNHNCNMISHLQLQRGQWWQKGDIFNLNLNGRRYKGKKRKEVNILVRKV